MLTAYRATNTTAIPIGLSVSVSVTRSMYASNKIWVAPKI